jgi:hypothetical protein
MTAGAFGRNKQSSNARDFFSSASADLALLVAEVSPTGTDRYGI